MEHCSTVHSTHYGNDLCAEQPKINPYGVYLSCGQTLPNVVRTCRFDDTNDDFWATLTAIGAVHYDHCTPVSRRCA